MNPKKNPATLLPMRPWRARRTFATVAVLALGLFFAAVGALEAQGRPGARRAMDPLTRNLFPPEMVMRHQAALGLSADQKAVLIEQVQALQTDLVPLQIEMSGATEAMGELLTHPAVDEAEVLAHADRVMDLEKRIKRRHLTLLVRLKNLLTAEQQAKLRRLRPGRR